MKKKVCTLSLFNHEVLSNDFFIAYFNPSGPFACILPKSLPIFPVLAVANIWFLCRPAE